MKSSFVALALGLDYVGGLGPSVFCCYDDVLKVIPQESLKILSPGNQNHCTTLEVFSNDYYHKLSGLNCTSVNPGSLKSHQAQKRFSKDSSSETKGFFHNYRTYNEMKSYLQELSNLPYGRFIESIGKTYENRDIFAFEIKSNLPSPCGRKRSIWINGGIHAREWISPASVIYTISQIMLNVNTYEIQELLRNYDFYFTPLSNPDGYVYSSQDRAWRKNTRDNGDGTFGVDLNRNWDDHWGEGDASNNPSEETFKGYSVHSEPEVQVLAQYALSIPNRFASLDIHSFGQKILRNWGWTTAPPRNDELLKRIAYRMIEVFANHGYNYITERAAEMYVAGGGLDNWMASKLGFISFTIELSPDNNIETDQDFLRGFQPPPNNILPVADSLFDAVKAYTNYLKNDCHFNYAFATKKNNHTQVV